MQAVIFANMQDAKSLTIRHILGALHAWAPPSLQESYDNSGLLVGQIDTEVTTALISLDCTEAVVEEAEVEEAVEEAEVEAAIEEAEVEAAIEEIEEAEVEEDSDAS